MKELNSLSFSLSTEIFAKKNGVKAQSVRARFCNTGSYFGIKPKKLANGRTIWPDVQVECMEVK